MRPGQFVPYPDGIGEVMRTPRVRAALAAHAAQITARARRLYAAENVDADVTVSEETRPKGRPTAKVLSDRDDAEYGTSNTAKRRILGRAAGLGG